MVRDRIGTIQYARRADRIFGNHLLLVLAHTLIRLLDGDKASEIMRIY